MNRLRTLVFSLAALLAPTMALAGAADDAALVNGKVQIAAENGDKGYRLTKNADYSAIRDKMMKRQALEEFAKFLSPMKLPKTLYIVAEECAGGPGASSGSTFSRTKPWRPTTRPRGRSSISSRMSSSSCVRKFASLPRAKSRPT